MSDSVPIDLSLNLNLLLLTAAALAVGGCDRLQHKPAKSSVTIKLPPPRAPQPGFQFNRRDGKR